jgi:hypothetical protein
MAWTKTRDPFAEQNIQNTNILYAPVGQGVPVSSKEYNINFLLRTQAEQELYRSIAPSGFATRLIPHTLLETTTTNDTDGELAALTTSSVPLANKIRLGRVVALVNGWKITLSNTAGTNGLHNDILLDTAPSSSGRFDLVFLEVWLGELGGTSASISNTTNKPDATHLYKFGNVQFAGTNVTDDISEIDQELNRRSQIQYRIRVVDNVDIDTFADGVDNTAVVKAWGANPGNVYSGFASGTGSVYTFANMGVTLNDPGLYRAGDGSTTAKSVLGSVDGYVYALPIAAIFRRNSGIYDPATNPLGCAAAGPTGGNIGSGISGRPDGFYYDQIDTADIMNLRHQVFIDTAFDMTNVVTEAFDRAMRGNLTSYFGRGDGAGAPAGLRSMYPMYAQEISTVGALDAGFKGFSQYNYQRRIFSDAAVTQQTQITYTGGAAPDNSKPTVLSPPSAPTGSVSTASGTLSGGVSPTGDYFVKITYVNSFGETLPSAETGAGTFHLTANGNITVNSPIASGNATGWNVYISGTTNTETKQNGGAIAIGTNYTQSVPLVGGAALPVANTSSTKLTIVADSSGLTVGTAKVVCVDGSATPGAGSLQPTNVNIVVYDANNFSVIAGSWSGLNTASATFTPTSPWAASQTTNGVVVVLGLSYPAGNGMTYRAENVVSQALVQGGTTTTLGQIGITGVTAADNSHLNLPVGVAVDSSGNIFISDTANHRVVKYNSSLVYQSQFGATGVSGADNTHLNTPRSVVVDNSGNIYISDSLNHRVVKLNSSLAYVAQFGVTNVSGSDTSHLNTPWQIALDSGQANIYVADSANSRIVRLTVALAFGASAVTTPATCFGVTVDALGNIYTTTSTHLLQKYTSGGALNATFGTVSTTGSTNYLLNTPLHVALDSSTPFPNILVADSGNHRLLQINPIFIAIGQFGVSTKTSTDKAHLNTASGVGIDSNGLIYITDTNNHRILKIHKQMGACDFPLRQFEVLYSGTSTDRLKIWYNYRPYQGVIGFQGSTAMNYTLRALTDIYPLVTTMGTGGRNANAEDNLNGWTVRLPFPNAAFGASAGTDTEYVNIGANLTNGGSDAAGILSNLTAAWGGSMSTFGSTNPTGLQMGPFLTGNLVKISQATASGYPLRGVNTIQRFIDNYTPNGGFDALGISYGTVNSTDHLTLGFFLAVASGGTATLPLIKGEIVMVVAVFRVSGTAAALYGQTSIASTVDVYRVSGRPIIRF